MLVFFFNLFNVLLNLRFLLLYSLGERPVIFYLDTLALFGIKVKLNS